jgi:hypothetical protein
MPSSDNAQGLVAITFNKKEEEIRFVFPPCMSIVPCIIIPLVYVLEDQIFSPLKPADLTFFLAFFSSSSNWYKDFLGSFPVQNLY